MSGRGTAWLGWLLGTLLGPPLVALVILMASQWSNTGAQFALFVYAIAMIGMGLGAAFTLAVSTAGRFGMFFLFTIGILFVQCAVFFVGCSIVVSRSL